MIDLTSFLNVFSKALDDRFGDRVWFVGLQGSYGRGEATETSDIDLVVILDTLSVSDIRSYHAMLDMLPHRELICGFLCGKEELFSWDTSDLFQFYYDTKPIKGSLDELLTLLDNAAVDRAIKLGACNVLHGCVHNMLYERSEEVLKGLYKSASFVMQATVFRKMGKYISRQKDLLEYLSDDEQYIIHSFLSLKNGEKDDFDKLSESLFLWSKKQITMYEDNDGIQ